MSDREQIIEWDGSALKEMINLKILIIKNAKFSEVPKCLPNSLRVLEWWGYPSNCLPSDFQPHKFVMCNLPDGCFTSFELNRSSKASLMSIFSSSCELINSLKIAHSVFVSFVFLICRYFRL